MSAVYFGGIGERHRVFFFTQQFEIARFVELFNSDRQHLKSICSKSLPLLNSLPLLILFKGKGVIFPDALKPIGLDVSIVLETEAGVN